MKKGPETSKCCGGWQDNCCYPRVSPCCGAKTIKYKAGHYLLSKEQQGKVFCTKCEQEVVA